MTRLTGGRRDTLRHVRATPTTHPGLWLHRYLTHPTWKDRKPERYDEDKARRAKDTLIRDVVGKPVPSAYREALTRWRTGFDPTRSYATQAESLGRVVVGLGAKGAGEFGITLHHTWGVPILPGSSLKGIAALGAARYLEGPEWEPRRDHARARDGEPNAYDALFGDVTEQGAVIFHDAWYVSGQGNGLYADVLTVHHPTWYQQEGGALTETDDPVPVPFVSAAGTFLFVLELAPGLSPERHGHWLDAAWTALREGLLRHGVGSKTNSAYGRFALPTLAELTEARAREEEAAKAREEEAAKVRAQAEADRLIPLATTPLGVMELLAPIRPRDELRSVLRHWLTGQDDHLSRFPLTEPSVIAVWRWAAALDLTSGMLKYIQAPELKAAVEVAMQPSPFGTDHMDEVKPAPVRKGSLTKERSNSRNDQLARQLRNKMTLRTAWDEDTVRRAIELLRDRGYGGYARAISVHYHIE